MCLNEYILDCIECKVKNHDFIVDTDLCNIKNVDKKTFMKFMCVHNLYGYKHCDIRYGMYLEDTLVACVGLNNIELNKYEISRYCSHTCIHVKNGLKYLTEYFEENYDYEQIIIYSDDKYFDNQSIIDCGFTKTNSDSNTMSLYIKENKG